MTILTLNIWDLPFITKDKGLRIERLFRGLRELQPDIICLQESWEPVIRERILSDIPNYQAPECCLGRRLGGMFDITGGLFTLVKRPGILLDTKFYPFHQHGTFCLEDALGKKGYLVSRLEYMGVRLTIVNTHLHARLLGGKRHHQYVRLRQIRELLTGIKGVDNLVLVGDFNFEPHDVEFQHMITTGFREACNDQGRKLSQLSNAYKTTYFNKLLSVHYHIDHIFYKKNFLKAVHVQTVFVDPPVSDHYGIMAEVEVI